MELKPIRWRLQMGVAVVTVFFVRSRSEAESILGYILPSPAIKQLVFLPPEPLPTPPPIPRETAIVLSQEPSANSKGLISLGPFVPSDVVSPQASSRPWHRRNDLNPFDGARGLENPRCCGGARAKSSLAGYYKIATVQLNGVECPSPNAALLM